MEIQEIEVTIGKDGQVLIHVRGAKGPVCLDLTKSLEDALGGILLNRELTPESGEKPDLPTGPVVEIKSGK